MLEYIKVEDILQKNNSKMTNEIRFERKETSCLQSKTVIARINDMIQELYI